MTQDIRNRLYEMVETMKDKLTDNEYKLFVEELAKMEPNIDYMLSLMYIKYNTNSTEHNAHVFGEVCEFKLRFNRYELDKAKLETFDKYYVTEDYRQIPVHSLVHMLPKLYHAHLHDILVPHETYVHDPNDDDNECDCDACSNGKKVVFYKTSQIQYKITKCSGEPESAPITAATDGLDTASSSSDDLIRAQVVDSDDESLQIDNSDSDEDDEESSESKDIDPPLGWDENDWDDMLERMCDISEGKYLNVVSGKDNVRSPKLVVDEDYRLCVLKRDKKKLDDILTWFEQFDDWNDNNVPQAVKLMRQRVGKDAEEAVRDEIAHIDRGN